MSTFAKPQAKIQGQSDSAARGRTPTAAQLARGETSAGSSERLPQLEQQMNQRPAVASLQRMDEALNRNRLRSSTDVAVAEVAGADVAVADVAGADVGMAEPMAPEVVVQRKTGLELQTHMPVRDSGGEDLDYQTEVFTAKTPNPVEAEEPQQEEIFRLESDWTSAKWAAEHNGGVTESVLEFITPPAESTAAVGEQMSRVDAMRQALDTATQGATTVASIETVTGEYQALVPPPEQAATEIDLSGALIGKDGGTWQERMHIDPQLTLGVDLEVIPGLLRRLLDDPTLIRRASWVPELLKALDVLDSQELGGKAKGLITLVKLYQAGGQMMPGNLYPKAATPFMARTDFHSMYQQLDANGQEQWQKWVAAETAGEDTPVFKEGFSDGDTKYNGPLYGQWLDSISNPAGFPLSQIDIDDIGETAAEDVLEWLRKYKSDEATRASFADRKRKQKLRQQGEQAYDDLENGVLPSEENFSSLMILVDSRRVDRPNGLELLAKAKVEFAEDMAARQEKDLMSRGEVSESAGSMGAFTVEDDDTDSEHGMAILELRSLTRLEGKASRAEEGGLGPYFVDVLTKIEQAVTAARADLQPPVEPKL